MRSNGFTLIELIVVIIIIGILAAVAAPKFINLKPAAQTATLKGIEASMDSVSAMVYGKSVVKGIQNKSFSFSDPTFITLEDGPLLVDKGYPQNSKADWLRLIDFDADTFSVVKTVDGAIVIYLTENDLPFNITEPCITYYLPVAPSRDKPVIGTNDCI